MNKRLGPRDTARQILRRSGQMSPPVSLRSILEMLPDLHVTVADLEGDGVFVDLGSVGGEIVLSRRGSDARRRFTLAHEIGHYVYVTSRSAQEMDNYEKIERWCNVFASELLVPQSMLHKAISEADFTVPYTCVSGMSRSFQVSVQNISIRMSEVAPFSVFILKSSESFPVVSNFPNLRYSKLTWRSEIFGFISDIIEEGRRSSVFNIDGVFYAIERYRSVDEDMMFVLVGLSDSVRSV